MRHPLRSFNSAVRLRTRMLLMTRFREALQNPYVATNGFGVTGETSINSPSKLGHLEAVLDLFECGKIRSGKGF